MESERTHLPGSFTGMGMLFCSFDMGHTAAYRSGDHENPKNRGRICNNTADVVFTCDFMQSFREAVDLKETLIKLSESSEHIRHMQKRLEVVSAFAEQDREIYQTKLWEKLAGRKELLQNLDEYRRIQRQKLREIEEKLVQIKEAGRQKAEELSSLQESLVKELPVDGGPLRIGNTRIPCASLGEIRE